MNKPRKIWAMIFIVASIVVSVLILPSFIHPSVLFSSEFGCDRLICGQVTEQFYQAGDEDGYGNCDTSNGVMYFPCKTVAKFTTVDGGVEYMLAHAGVYSGDGNILNYTKCYSIQDKTTIASLQRSAMIGEIGNPSSYPIPLNSWSGITPAYISEHCATYILSYIPAKTIYNDETSHAKYVLVKKILPSNPLDALQYLWEQP